ncbi:hypothetical protein M434DRAFT_157595 [Hypoxylon sp. CO27-5]|nr:hypothetical protein M434DRAFT_157595 [Hypoxylon sp. CO27-5]
MTGEDTWSTRPYIVARTGREQEMVDMSIIPSVSSFHNKHPPQTPRRLHNPTTFHSTPPPPTEEVITNAYTHALI